MWTDRNPMFSRLADRAVLVTGGAGFIGSHLSAALVELGAEVRVLDDLSSGFERNLPPGVEFIRGSVTDERAVFSAARGCEVVFHEAAMVSVPQSVAEPERCFKVNIGGTERVLRAARDHGVRRVILAASAAAYGNTPSLPSSEDHAPDCWSPYAASKVAGELLLASYAKSYAMSTASLRYFNIFGPRQDPKSPYAAVISAFLDAAAARRTPIVHGDGTQSRDFTPVENVVHANLLAAISPRALAGEVVNIGTGRRISLLDVLRVIAEKTGRPVAPTFTPPRAGDVMHSCAGIQRARELLGYEPIVSFEEGLARTMAASGL